MFHDINDKKLQSKTQNTQNTKNTWDTKNDLLKPSRFDPDCVLKARESPTPTALKVILSWQKRRGIPETQRIEFVKTFCAYHNMNFDSTQLLDVLNTQPFSCEYILELGFCDEENCRIKLPPAERLILDTESVIIFHSSGEIDIKIAGRRKIIPLKKFFKKIKGETKINTSLFDEIFLECYYLPPNPSFTEEEAYKVYTKWLEEAEHVKLPVDAESGIEDTVIEILTTKRDYYSFDLLKEKRISPKRGFFIKDDVIYVESALFKELLEEAGVKDRKEKIVKAIQRLLAGNSKRIRIGKELYYFWRFNLKAIQAILRRDGEEWIPEIRTTPDDAELVELLSGGSEHDN